ncbi:DUF1285 domain-containing protein [Billgrantia endophytica]|uniref:DUF1285 domain-containing protein n=1 Tax=Billgrantia endophytica TaxID=2033802 RepID=A0A2N7U3U8_9GAMM|nr:DUF1285 domain-containing protein [Halomonas endophytica]PMR75097.1 DUF1285 domain-containing protein [Halomonas endophytica]
MNLEPLLEHVEPVGEIPPLDRWHPGQAGEMDLLIAADGRWIHEGTVMSRPRLIRLLSTLLRREEDGHYYLVTPVEKQRIQVEDRPFVIVDAEHDDESDSWWLTTNVGDRLRLDGEHRLVVSETPDAVAVPEVAVRFGLSARLGRNVFYRLVERAEQRQGEEGRIELGLTSAETWQPLGDLPAEDS